MDGIGLELNFSPKKFHLLPSNEFEWKILPSIKVNQISAVQPHNQKFTLVLIGLFSQTGRTWHLIHALISLETDNNKKKISGQRTDSRTRGTCLGASRWCVCAPFWPLCRWSNRPGRAWAAKKWQPQKKRGKFMKISLLGLLILTCVFSSTPPTRPPPPLSHSSRALFSPLANLRCGGLWAGPATCHVTGGQSAPFGSVGAGGAAAQILPLTSQFFLIFIFSLTSRSRRMVTCFHTFSVISARFWSSP